MTYNLSSYNYHLPSNLIAQTPHHPADQCRLMVVQDGDILHHRFDHIVDHISGGDLIIFNDSKVVPARVALTVSDTIITKTGEPIIFKLGEAEIFFLRQYSYDTFEALVRRGKWFKQGSIVQIDKYVLMIGETTEAGRMITVSLSGGQSQDDIVMQFLHEHGTIPLPPYIADDPNKYDEYQPIMARQEGSVAAPTAALHFTDRLLHSLTDVGVQQTSVTLHIGIGTFRLIEVDDVRDHEIHREVCQIDLSLLTQIAHTHQQGNKITIVGTTSCRTIESLPYLYHHISDQLSLDDEVRSYWDELTTGLDDGNNYIINPVIIGDPLLQGFVTTQIHFETQLYMYPGFTPKIVDHLVTNFHLPQSTLLLMIASLIGYDLLMQCYELAIQQEYHFYSFGDAMLLKNLKKNGHYINNS